MSTSRSTARGPGQLPEHLRDALEAQRRLVLVVELRGVGERPLEHRDERVLDPRRAACRAPLRAARSAFEQRRQRGGEVTLRHPTIGTCGGGRPQQLCEPRRTCQRASERAYSCSASACRRVTSPRPALAARAGRGWSRMLSLGASRPPVPAGPARAARCRPPASIGALEAARARRRRSPTATRASTCPAMTDGRRVAESESGRAPRPPGPLGRLRPDSRGDPIGPRTTTSTGIRCPAIGGASSRGYDLDRPDDTAAARSAPEPRRPRRGRLPCAEEGHRRWSSCRSSTRQGTRRSSTWAPSSAPPSSRATRSREGGPQRDYVLLFGHLDAPRPGLHQGARLAGGDLVGFVGRHGLARARAPAPRGAARAGRSRCEQLSPAAIVANANTVVCDPRNVLPLK